MNKPFIFISCGQYTQAEKALGKNIVKLVKDITGLEAFFAEDVQDLNGLDSNILTALRDCSAFITVMHPRGKIGRPDGSTHIRASVWIEQEIAIATYIRRTEQRELPVIAFIHKSVGREGIRDLLHLNPVEFSDESEILMALPEPLLTWKNLSTKELRVHLRSEPHEMQHGHPMRKLVVSLINASNERINHLTCLLRVPSGLLKPLPRHSHSHEIDSHDNFYRHFRVNESDLEPIEPHETVTLFTLNYCTTCAIGDMSGNAALGDRLGIEATVWTGGQEYKAEKTVTELAMEAATRIR